MPASSRRGARLPRGRRPGCTLNGRVVIVGAGHAGIQLADSLRDESYEGEIVVVGEETEQPYQRPPLTKDYLHDRASATLLPLRGEDFYAERRIRLVLGRRADSIDPRARRLLLDDGTELAYDHLILATGARCRPHPALVVPAGPAVHTIRSASDAQRFGREIEAASSLLVVGAGFVGLEVAAAARTHDVDVTIVASRPPLSRIASAPISSFLLNAHRDRGSRFLFDEVTVIESIPDVGASITCAAAGRLTADLVLVAVGADANSELAAAAGLDVSTGVVVDEFSQSSDERIWAIGDVASRRLSGQAAIREESVQAATHQARCLARTLTGTPTRCSDVPWFWSTQGSLRLQIAGLPEAGTQAVLRGDPSGGRFSVFNYRDDRLAFVESVNSAGDHLAARRILATRRPISAAQASDLAFDLKAFSLNTSGAAA